MKTRFLIADGRQIPEVTWNYVAGHGDISKPILIPKSHVKPKYPRRALNARVNGRVVLLCVVDENGIVKSCRVLESRDEKYGFGKAAMKAVENWRYSPALQDGKPVSVYFTIVVDFFLSR